MILFFLLTITFHTITVDGDLSDFSEDEKVLSDRYGDSFWGLQNELEDFYLTWDRNNIYLGAIYTVRNNALMIIIDAGKPGLQDLDILNFYPRNIKLTGISANFLIALWDADLSKGGFRKVDISGSTTDLTSSVEIINNGSSGIRSYIEAKIPFNLIFENGFSQGASIKIFLCIAGGDHSGSGDISPDNVDVDGIPPEYVRKYLVVYFDKNSDSRPDSAVKPVENSRILESQFEKFNVLKFEVKKENMLLGDVAECSIMLSQTSNVNLFLISEEGKLVKKIYQGPVIKGELRNFLFTIKKPGIYILLLEIPGKLREKKIIKVIK